jgi:hypothetical protein
LCFIQWDKLSRPNVAKHSTVSPFLVLKVPDPHFSLEGDKLVVGMEGREVKKREV